LELGQARVPVVSCITGRPYQNDAKEIWTRHATAPVDFVGGLQSCSDAKVFVQVAAGNALLAFARAPGRQFVSARAGEPDGGRLFLNALGQLFVLGVPVELPDRGTLVTLPA